MKTINGRDVNNIPFLQAKSLGPAREHLFFRNGRQVLNQPQDKAREIFCTYEGRDGTRKSFWLCRTPEVDYFFDQLFQESRYNQHIHFIEWEDKINCSVEDGIYISHTNFFMTKEEFAKFLETIIPYDEFERSIGNEPRSAKCS